MTIGERIQQARKRANNGNGITQAELAKRLGVSASMIGQYETGVRNPKVYTMERIAYALGIPVGELLGWPEDLAAVIANMFPNDDVELDENGHFNLYHDPEKDRINAAYVKLNDAGQSEAAKRVEELTEIPKYQREPDKG